MNYQEWKNLKQIDDEKLIKGFEYETGERFYIEAPFYTQLMGIKERYPEEFEKVILQMEKIVKTAKYVVFAYDFENPFIEKEGYIYREITDVTDPIKLFFEDKSRGSDYGD